MNTELYDNVKKFIAGVQEKIDLVYTTSPATLTVTLGKKYYKVIKTVYGQDSVYAFIDKETGDIFKPACYAKPAKHARGNVNAPDNGVSCADAYSINYLRR